MNLFENPMSMALLGGVLIGIAWGALAALTGRIMSASGMIGSLLEGGEGAAAPSIAFLGGLVSVSLVMSRHGFAQHAVADPGWPFLVVGGLLIGVSARWGGASLGMAAAGITRRAPRSIAVLLTILFGVVLGAILQVSFGIGGEA